MVSLKTPVDIYLVCGSYTVRIIQSPDTKNVLYAVILAHPYNPACVCTLPKTLQFIINHVFL